MAETGRVRAVGEGFLTIAGTKHTWDISVLCRGCVDEYILIMFFYDEESPGQVEMLVKHRDHQRKASAENWQFWAVFNVIGGVLAESGCNEWPWDSETHALLYDLELP